ncbi:hypothetical protein OUZ56_018682 [Daphnia magna]|uniref:Uncharacterized protein n=1 Tax=Daphnia magna TaxID=35525 RepID=A0ABQ9Z9I2_9CRUS|nr:hypothetical protein OUZ56_018682 [Daphnia magna]
MLQPNEIDLGTLGEFLQSARSNFELYEEKETNWSIFIPTQMKKRRKEPEGKYFFNSAEDTVFSGSSKMRADVYETFDLLTDTVPLFIADYFEWLALLASGRLPPETFPSAQLRTVLSEIRSSLASGRALTPVLQRDLWRAYQEANVVTASTENGLNAITILLSRALRGLEVGNSINESWRPSKLWKFQKGVRVRQMTGFFRQAIRGNRPLPGRIPRHPTEGHQLDTPNSFDRQAQKIGVNVTSSYNRLDP